MSETRIKLCPGCRQIKEMSVHRHRCKPCYNEWVRLHRLERKAKQSEKVTQ